MTGTEVNLPARLSDLLVRAARNFPEHQIGFLRPDRSIRILTYPELLSTAKRLLGAFNRSGIRKGDKVILSLDTSEEVIPALWACFLGGIVPTLLQPPLSFTEYNPAAEKAGKVYRLLGGPKVILSHSHYESWLNGGIPAGSLVDMVSPDPEMAEGTAVESDSSGLALLQFSSGSTGDPKGVMLSHGNIMVNIHDISQGLRLMPHDVSVSWMPLFHDMGLMGFHMTALYIGCHQFFIEPADFIKNPLLWLDAMSDLKATITGCPNFGQMLVNRAIARKRNPRWDLSALRAVFNGAEPISVNTMEEFHANLAPFGFNPKAMLPAYGMAEATLAVTFSSLEAAPQVFSFDRQELLGHGIAVQRTGDDSTTVKLVNLGTPLFHCEVRIAGEEGGILPEGRAGQVLVRGKNVTSGYFGNPGETGDTIREGWLFTGDLGFFFKGNLFILGRYKDIIFINGMNYYAHDLETIALQVDGVAYGKIVMAGYFDEKEGRDKVIVFMVTPANEASRDIFSRIRQHFLNTIGLQTDIFIPVRSNDIQRTSSGKIQRYKLVNRFLTGELIPL